MHQPVMLADAPPHDGVTTAPQPRLPSTAALADDAGRGYTPPLTGKTREAAVLFEILAELRATYGLHIQSAHIQWDWITGPLAAARELAHLMADAEESLRKHNQDVKAHNDAVDREAAEFKQASQNNSAELAVARSEFARRSAQVGIVVPASEFAAESQKVPDKVCFAGATGVDYTPVGRRGSVLGALAPIIIGPVTGACISTLVGLISYADIMKIGFTWPKFTLPAAIGACIVALAGGVSQRLGQAAALRETLPNREVDGQPGRPTTLHVAALGLATVALTAAEVAAEALGLQDLHQQHSDFMQIMTGTPLPAIPGAVLAVVCTVFSAPYIAWKCTAAHEHTRQTLIGQWLSSHQWAWRERRLADPRIQDAARAAQEVILLEARQQAIERGLAALDAKRRQPLATYPSGYGRRIGILRGHVERLAHRLQSRLQGITNALQPLPQRPLWAHLWARLRGEPAGVHQLPHPHRN